MECSDETASKFLSWVLRHQPQAIGLQLDAQGWASIETLLRLAQPTHPLTRAQLQRVVAHSDKQRFALSADGLRIRANQGHSLSVDLGLASALPPPQLYHGTATRFLEAIRREGLRPGQRQHVHLTASPGTALQVGQRYGQAVVLTVRTQAMAEAGHAFHRADNGVWLTAQVPVAFIDFAGADA
ncbi:RNA 2'-phosphotransferase [Xanthomonas bundabergensis]|uniref:RNA 2'-phosphotransferase n=1 Tax=Xanthomonas bundabergensis TaxID=3160842 RepID=UPI003512669E